MNDTPSSPDGDRIEPDPTLREWLDALGRFVDRHRAHYVVRAEGWIRQHRVNTVRFGADDAIDEALLEFAQRISLSHVPTIPTPDEFQRGFPTILKQIIIDRSRLQHADKRSRETVYLSTLKLSDFDRIDERAATPEQIASDKEGIRRFLDDLRRRDRRLRAVVVMRMKEYTNKEIAQVLKVSLSRVERMVRRIQSIAKARFGTRK